MAVGVKAAEDIRSDTGGTLRVPKGSSGTVDAVGGNPLGDRFQVTFTIEQVGGDTTDQLWVDRAQLLFDDGEIGPARAVFEGNARTITQIRYPSPVMDYPGRLGEQPTTGADEVEVVFSDSTVLKVAVHRSRGEVDISIL